MVLITDNRDQDNLARFSHLKWVFIGSHTGCLHLKGLLNENNRIFIGKEIEDTIDLIRDNFIDFLGKISQHQNNKVLWYSSRMASKSIQTSMFNQYIYLKVLEKFLGSSPEDILIITDDKEFLYNAAKVFSNKIKFLNKKSLSLRPFSESQSKYAKIGRYCIFWFLAGFFKNRKLNSFNIFIHSWIDERAFRKLPHYNDVYFNELEGILKKQGHNTARLTPLFVPLSNILKLNRNFDNIVHPLSYITLGDLFKNIFTVFKADYNNDMPGSVKDKEILSFLFKNEVYKENRSKNYLEYLLFFSAYKKICSIINNNSVLIYPFENQPWEKMLNLGFAGLNRIAYQHSTIPYNWLDYRFSEYENSSLLPKTILTVGLKWADFLKRYSKDSVVEVAGAIRFSYLFNEGYKKVNHSRSGNIVVVLDMMPGISIPLQKLLLSFLKNNDLSGYTIKIKPHQYLPEYACFKNSFTGFTNCKFVNDNMSELLKDCSLLVVSNSSVVFESVLSGIKTMYFIPEEPSLGFERFIRDSLYIAYEKDFAEKFQEALESTKRPDISINEYFSPPDYNVFIKHLKAKP